ncbi:TolC family protein [Shewanella algae]|uniref:TolC family protein n=1 Tax=Shewanella algae TaxID=38313 RepID=UPI0031F4BD2F
MKIRPLYLGCSLLLMVFQLRAAPETDRDALLALSQNRLHTSSAQLAPIYHSSDWLTGLPSISLSHLGSLESHNSYEQELSLNLPFQSPAMQRQNAKLKPINERMLELQSQLQRLYLSGLLRQYWWQQAQAEQELAQLRHKQQVLQQLLLRQQALSRSGEMPATAVLLLKRELLELSLTKLPLEQQQQEANEALIRLTGLQQLPSLDESDTPLPDDAGAGHPMWQLLALQQQRQQLTTKAQLEGDDTPWLVSVTAKNTATQGLDEQSLGLALEIPLPVGNGLNQQQLGELQQQRLQLEQQQQQQLLQSQLQLQQLKRRQAQLQQEQQGLEQAVLLSKQLSQTLLTTAEQGPAQYESWLRRHLEALDTQARLSLNRLAQAQLHSQQLQALGVTL